VTQQGSRGIKKNKKKQRKKTEMQDIEQARKTQD
jgi:hypothetical protein